MSVVSTCSLTIETLPSNPKGDRNTLIQAHFDTVAKTGSTLPDNLRLFLQDEQKKATKVVNKPARKRNTAY